jgi:leader peptidase (prepilin peptidase)/N-methyltransferase
MLYLAAFFGLIIGTIVNLLADSLPVARVVHRSQCTACGGPRPIHAWSGLLARCSSAWSCAYCGTDREQRSFWVEIFAILGAFGLALYNPLPSFFWPTLIIGFVFLLIVVIDIEHRLILHIVTFPAGILFFFIAGFNPDLTYTRSLLGGALGFVLFFLLYLLGAVFGKWMARRRGIEQEEVAFGFGDVTLASVIGLLLGFPAVIEALIRGILYAGIFSIGYLLYLAIRRRYTSFIPIPYGPFLVLGAVWVYFQGWTSLERLLGM